MKPAEYAAHRAGMVVLYEEAGQTEGLKLVGSEDFGEESTVVLKNLGNDNTNITEMARFNS